MLHRDLLNKLSQLVLQLSAAIESQSENTSWWGDNYQSSCGRCSVRGEAEQCSWGTILCFPVVIASSRNTKYIMSSINKQTLLNYAERLLSRHGVAALIYICWINWRERFRLHSRTPITGQEKLSFLSRILWWKEFKMVHNFGQIAPMDN